MKRYLKKSLALLLALMMVLSTTSVMAMAEDVEEPEDSSIESEETNPVEEATFENDGIVQLSEVASGTCGDNLTWVLDDDGTLTISGTGDMNNFYSGGAPWYSYRESIKTVVIESGVTSIGNSAFYNCTNSTSIQIPDSVTSIGSSAFNYCSSLTDIIIPDKVTSLESGVFCWCTALKSITIGNGVTSIGSDAFYYCYSLRSITIPDSVTSIGDFAFSDCTDLRNASIGNNVTSIGQNAFQDCYSLTSITIPDSVISIGVHAFGNCTSLTSVTLGENLSKIENDTFSNCPGLTNIVISDSVTSIGEQAFASCRGLTSVYIGNNVASIGKNAFRNCTVLKEFIASDENPYYCSVDGVLFNKDKTILVLYPFGGESSYEIPDGVISIGDDAFYECPGLTNIILPESLTTICDNAFYGCTRLADITIPNGVTSIGDSAFRECTSLTSITIPSSVTVIEEWAFYNCTGLQEITFVGNAPTTKYDFLYGVTAVAYYPGDNNTWTEEAMQSCGGNITWVPYVHTHDWGVPVFVWAEDYSSAIATRTCTTCGEVETVDAVVTSEATDPTCTEPGTITYTATANFDGTNYTDTVVVETASPLGHTWGQVTFKWADDYSSATASRTCTVCDETETVEATVTSVTTEPTCTEDGETVYTATADFDGVTYTDVQSEILPATGHTWGEITFKWKDDYSSLTGGSRTCIVCGTVEESFSVYGTSTTIKPTCTEPGEIIDTGTVVFPDGTSYTDQVIIETEPATGHTWGNVTWTWSSDYSSASASRICTVCSYKETVQATVTSKTISEPTETKEGKIDYTATATFSDQTVVSDTVSKSIPVVVLNGFVEVNGTWYYYEDGKQATTRNDVIEGTVNGTSGWWYVVGGKVQLNFTGVANYSNAYGWWYIKNGIVDFSKTGIEQNNYGWWRVVNGKVDFSCNSVEQNDYGWWYLLGGQVQFGYTGVANYANAYGWWYINGGKVDFSRNSVEQNNFGWWYVVGGKVDFSYTGVGNYCNDYGWWYISGGKVDFSKTSVEQNNFGWWRVVNGKVDFSFNGWATNSYGRWYCVNGKVDFSKS